MTASAWIAIVFLFVALWFLRLLAIACDQRDEAYAELARLNRQLDEALSDYGAQIAQSKRMALRVVERSN